MALLQDIEKASAALGSHRTNCNNDDAYLNIARKMKESMKATAKMSKVLDDLAKEVKQANQKELTKEQQKEFDAAESDMASASVYVLWSQVGSYSDDFAKDHRRWSKPSSASSSRAPSAPSRRQSLETRSSSLLNRVITAGS